MTLPVLGLRAYQTRELKDVYGTTDVPPGGNAREVEGNDI